MYFQHLKVKTNFQRVIPTWEQIKIMSDIIQNMSDIFQNISDLFVAL